MWEVRKAGLGGLHHIVILPRVRTASEAHAIIFRDGGSEHEYRLFRIEEEEYPVDLKSHGYDPDAEREGDQEDGAS